MSALTHLALREERRRRGALASAGVVVHRNYLTYRRMWWLFLSGFLEPVLYLFSIGVGVGQLVTGFEVDGREISYAAFVAPGMLAFAAMNGTLLDATMNFFFKLKFAKTFDQMLATPLSTRDIALGELAWSLARGGIYSTAFLLLMVVLGLVQSWWAVLVVPAALLIGVAFGAVGMALTTWMRTFQDFEWVTVATLPMFLFSATFYPVTTYPRWLQLFAEITPLYRGVVLVRELCLGTVGPAALVSVVYLLLLGVAGLLVVRRRLDRLLLR
ncbi:ABC transporter [Nakamurella flava]|uniref:Transport permease protein n=1 Tax=Nakamurella flava TaxID=2576308 RepID=A0A4U6QKX8_9ACTN|nr:ABC transporter permease [Nakamurella flava]TKV60782.1 ABC transporter [Nakamurella flava]